MSHLESLIAEYLDWQGYIVKQNLKVGRLAHGGWAMELDVVAYHPHTRDLVHYEPSIDAHSWETRERRYKKKFAAGRTFIPKNVFSWLPKGTPIRQIAVFISHPKGRDSLGGGRIISMDELMAEIRAAVIQQGMMSKQAIPENYPLLRILQLSHCGYAKVVRSLATN